jgi:hypothetical protein
MMKNASRFEKQSFYLTSLHAHRNIRVGEYRPDETLHFLRQMHQGATTRLGGESSWEAVVSPLEPIISASRRGFLSLAAAV